jgi:hypothetical protein
MLLQISVFLTNFQDTRKTTVVVHTILTCIRITPTQFQKKYSNELVKVNEYKTDKSMQAI